MCAQDAITEITEPCMDHVVLVCLPGSVGILQTRLEALEDENARLRHLAVGAWVDYDKNPRQMATDEYDSQPRGVLAKEAGDKVPLHQLCEADVKRAAGYECPYGTFVSRDRLEALEAYERYGAGEEYRSDYRTAAELRAAYEALWVENKGLKTRLEALERLEQLHAKWKEAIAARTAAKAEWDKQAVPEPLEIARVVSELITAKEALEAWKP